MIAYKLFRYKNNKLYPLYVYSKEEIPLNSHINAKEGTLTESGKVKSTLGELAYRPGFHCTAIPLADHIGKKMRNGKLCQRKDTVWCEVMMDDENDYTDYVKTLGKNPRHWYMKTIPTEGLYTYKTNSLAKVDWFITSGIIVRRILTNSEVKQICVQNGFQAQITEEEYMEE